MIDLSFIPKKYRERVARLEKEDGLIDECKYMLYMNKGWNIFGEDGFWCSPVKSKKEALEVIKDAYYKEQEED